MNALLTIQQKLKAPKAEFNSFGGYHFRSKEGIIEKLKPLLAELNCTLSFKDELLHFPGEGFFIKSVATLSAESANWSANGLAKHADEIKGMQAAQITGATASYAQKSALEALFLIDGSGNIDAMNPTVKTKTTTTPSTPETSDNKSPWLNVGTKEFTQALEDLKAGKVTVADLKKKYRISKVTESKLK